MEQELRINDRSYTIYCEDGGLSCEIEIFFTDEDAGEKAKIVSEKYMKKDYEWELYDYEDEEGRNNVGYSFKGPENKVVVVEYCYLNDYPCMYLVRGTGSEEEVLDKVVDAFSEYIDGRFQEIEELEKREN